MYQANLERRQIENQRKKLSKWREAIERWSKSGFPYEYWVTLSFREKPDLAEGEARVLGWLRHTASWNSTHLAPFMVAEAECSKRRFSIHAILLSERELSCSALDHAWRCGNTKIELYDENRGAPEYSFSKHVWLPTGLICPAKRNAGLKCRKTRKNKVVCEHEKRGLVE